MTDPLYDALEICLQALEKDADLEACLKLFPSLADELRPILETAIEARAQAVQDVPADAMRRGRARVLQHAAELRERKRGAILPFWRKPIETGRTFRVVATSLTTVVFLFSSGTGLVFASSNSIPGDNLYPVKRSWEGVQLAFILDPASKLERENEFEHERVQEIHELFSESRQTRVDFQGMVEAQTQKKWQVAGLEILFDDEAIIDKTIVPGMLVRVTGETEHGVIKAERITIIDATISVSPTPQPQRTSTLPPASPATEHPTDEPAETQEPDKTVEPTEPQKTEVETPEPRETDAHDKEPTQKKPDDNNGGDD